VREQGSYRRERSFVNTLPVDSVCHLPAGCRTLLTVYTLEGVLIATFDSSSIQVMYLTNVHTNVFVHFVVLGMNKACTSYVDS